jgi:hypothetical protein
MLADQMVQALDSSFTMAAESSTGISALKRNLSASSEKYLS